MLRLRSLPDIGVFDQSLNCIYQVEVKATEQTAQSWRYDKERLDRLRNHHPEAYLMVFRQMTCDFLCQKVNGIDWEKQGVSRDGRWYAIDLLSTFEAPPVFFPSMAEQEYNSALTQIRQLLTEFVPRP